PSAFVLLDASAMQLRLVKASALVFAMAAIGCGGGGSSSSTSTPSAPSAAPAAAPASATITIVGQSGKQAFTPNPAAFGGQSVVFKNSDAVTHRVVLNDGS